MRAALLLVVLLALGCEPVVLAPYGEYRLPIIVEGPGFEAWEGAEVELFSEVFSADGVVQDGTLLIVEERALPLDAGTELTFILFVDQDDDDNCEAEPALRFVSQLRQIGDVYRVDVDYAEGLPTQECASLPDD